MPDARFVESIPMPEREATINYTGGSISASRGVLAAMFKPGQYDSGCESVLKDRSRKTYTRTDYIGAPSRVVQPSTWQEVKYNSATKSIAKGGEPIQIKIEGEWWTARLSGSHSNFMTYLCGENQAGNLGGVIAWRSERGTTYGPVGQFAQGGN